MARPRSDVLYTPSNGNCSVYVKAHRNGGTGRIDGYRIFWTDASGTAHESSRTTLEAATRRADELALASALPSGTHPFISLIEDHLIGRRPDHWSDGYASQQIDLAKWFEPLYGVACAELGPSDVEDAVEAIRAAGLAASTEAQVVGLWNRMMEFGRKWGYVATGQVTTCRIQVRKIEKIRSIGEADKVWHRDDLPGWEDLFAYARATADRTGIWWEELRVLWLLCVGERWGEHVGQRGSDLWLAPGSTLAPGQVRVQGKVTENSYKRFVWEDYTKNGTVRVTAYPSQLHELVDRRYQELDDPSELLFPGMDGDFASRSSYRSRVFLPAGQKVGWPLKSQRANGKASALIWHPHDFRHVCATSMLTTPSEDPERWFEGRGMSPYEVALALGDSVETILRTYVGRSEAAVERVRTAAGW